MKKRLIFSLLGGILVLLVLGNVQPYIRPHMLGNAVELLLAWPIYLGYRIFGAEHQKLMILVTVVENVTVSSAILYSILFSSGVGTVGSVKILLLCLRNSSLSD